MKRFIDLGEQILEGERCFAFYDTVVDRFEEYYGEQVWTSWADFEENYTGNELPRYRQLVPVSLLRGEWPKIDGGGDE